MAVFSVVADADVMVEESVVGGWSGLREGARWCSCTLTVAVILCTVP